MFCDLKFGKTAYVAPFGIDVGVQVVFGTMYETHKVGVLLNGTTLTQVTELRALALVSCAARFDASVELRKGYDGYV